ncbi:hypothetical protein COO60DRAFT_1524817 [Scenedesmus sp. NREL 46B-D3]|nr:hypothetical protein COO60DRAFT_1524817 [Scenedesmus sp. NREL 46B-D3]
MPPNMLCGFPRFTCVGSTRTSLACTRPGLGGALRLLLHLWLAVVRQLRVIYLSRLKRWLLSKYQTLAGAYGGVHGAVCVRLVRDAGLVCASYTLLAARVSLLHTGALLACEAIAYRLVATVRHLILQHCPQQQPRTRPATVTTTTVTPTTITTGGPHTLGIVRDPRMVCRAVIVWCSRTFPGVCGLVMLL